MILRALLFLFLNISIFALKIDSTNFDLQLTEGQRGKKSFLLSNDKNYPLRYTLYIENQLEEVKVKPSLIIIPAMQKREIEVSALGKNKGKHSYFLVLEEEKINMNSKDSEANLKMKYRIEQKYFVE